MMGALATAQWVRSMLLAQAILGGARLAGPPHQEIVNLTWPTVVTLAHAQGPAVVLAAAARREVAAGLTGADIFATANPVLTGVGGHYASDDSSKGYDAFYLRLSWPLPVTGDYASRRHVASRRLDVAELEVRNALREAVIAALGLVVDAQAARDLRAVAARRLAWDEDIVRVTQQRHSQRALEGEPKTGDLAVAHLLRAQQQAFLRRVEADEEASLARLRRGLGLAQDVHLNLPQKLEGIFEPPSREHLLEHLPRRPDLRRNLGQIETARADHKLQVKLGFPVPNLITQGGKTPENYVLGGADLPLPVFQRNQVNRAVTEAQVARRLTEAQQALAQAEADLVVAYAQWEGQAAALDSLVENELVMGEAEKLAQQSYTRNEQSLAQLIVARREGNQAHIALVELRRAVGRARLELAYTGGEPLPFTSGSTNQDGTELKVQTAAP